MSDQTELLDPLPGITARVDEATNRIHAAIKDLYAPADGHITAAENAILLASVACFANEIGKSLNAALINDERIDCRGNLKDFEPETILKLMKSENATDRIVGNMTNAAILLTGLQTAAGNVAGELYLKENPNPYEETRH